MQAQSSSGALRQSHLEITSLVQITFYRLVAALAIQVAFQFRHSYVDFTL
jgi:hypothetical protein